MFALVVVLGLEVKLALARELDALAMALDRSKFPVVFPMSYLHTRKGQEKTKQEQRIRISLKGRDGDERRITR